MSALEGLLAACREAPDDDGPRLVWADAVGGERGELVVVQCELARGGLTVERSRMLRERERELIEAHGVEWSSLDESIATRAVFRRGFVEAVHAADLTEATLFALLGKARMLSSLTVRVDRDGLDLLLAQPELAMLQGLVIYETSRGDTLDDSLVQRVEHLPLRTLGIFADIDISRLLDSPLLATVERLALGWTEPDERTVAELCARAPRLRALHLDTSEPFAAIGTQIVELSVPVWTHRGRDENNEPLQRLAASPVARSLVRLACAEHFGVHPEAFAAFTRLRSLDLGETIAGRGRDPQSWKEIPARFAQVHLPTLRELVLPIVNDETPLLDLVEKTYGDQLELLTNKTGCSNSLLQVGVDMREPWLQRGLVKLRPW